MSGYPAGVQAAKDRKKGDKPKAAKKAAAKKKATG